MEVPLDFLEVSLQLELGRNPNWHEAVSLLPSLSEPQDSCKGQRITGPIAQMSPPHHTGGGRSGLTQSLAHKKCPVAVLFKIFLRSPNSVTKILCEGLGNEEFTACKRAKQG